MKITILENEHQAEIEIVIQCRENNEQVAKLVASLSNYDKKLTGIKDGKTFVLDSAEILYFDSVDKKTFAYTAAEVYETGLRLYELAERLPQHFFRASKATIINIDKIKSISPDFGGRFEVTMISGERMAVSRQYAHDLKAKLDM